MLNAVITGVVDGNTLYCFLTEAKTAITVKLARVQAPPQNPRDDQVTPADVSRMQLCQLASAKQAKLRLLGDIPSEVGSAMLSRMRDSSQPLNNPFQGEFVGEVEVDQGGGSWINASDKMVDLGAAVYVE